MSRLEYYLASQSPALQRMKPSAMLSMTYMMAVKENCLPISPTPSKANVLNVVKPPQKPVAKNSNKLPCIHWLRSARPKITPIRKQPVILIRNVAQGKAKAEDAGISRDMPYRNMLPNAPPMPTKKKFFIMALFIKSKTPPVKNKKCRKIFFRHSSYIVMMF